MQNRIAKKREAKKRSIDYSLSRFSDDSFECCVAQEMKFCSLLCA